MSSETWEHFKKHRKDRFDPRGWRKGSVVKLNHRREVVVISEGVYEITTCSGLWYFKVMDICGGESWTCCPCVGDEVVMW